MVINKEKRRILKTMMTEYEAGKLLMISMVILMGTIFSIARRNLRQKTKTMKMNLHLKDGVVKHHVTTTKMFGITIRSQGTTTMNKKEVADDYQ